MSFIGATTRLGAFVLGALLGACTPAIQYQLDSDIGEQQEEFDRSRRAAKAEQPSRSSAPSRGDDEDTGEPGSAENRGLPLVTLPGFKMLPSGRSRVFVEVTGRVEVSEDDEGRVLKLHLRGVGVPEKVNRLPLVTSHFESAVERVRVLPIGDGADVVIELRAKVEHWTKLKPSRVGTRLTVDFGKPPEKRADALKATTGFDQQAPERLATREDLAKSKAKKGPTRSAAAPAPAPAAKPAPPPAPAAKEEPKPAPKEEPKPAPKEEPKAAPEDGGAPKLETTSPL
ncbi:MAG: hypothetical protein FJ096_21660 [Deltaproteobacteria bacterium]|nr:hypothetical protein [Deltaproteobacteria bacterium]